MARTAGGAIGLMILLTSGPPLSAAEKELVEIFDELGVPDGELTVGADLDWLGHPDLGAVPYVLPHVQVVRREPLRLAAYGQNLLHVAEVAKADETGGLLRIATAFLMTPRLVGFRGILPSLVARTTAGETGDDFEGLSGKGEDAGFPVEIREPILDLLESLQEAARIVERSWLDLDRALVAAAVTTPDVPRLLPGGTVAWPQLSIAAAGGDDTGRAQAALLVLAAVERATEKLEGVGGGERDRWEMKTRWGRVVVTGAGDDEHRCEQDCFLVVDLGGNDRYTGSTAAAIFPATPISVNLDLGGDDSYRSAGPGQGAGLGGVGLLLDVAGNDIFEAADSAQGYGLLGYGLLVDRDGDDHYELAGGGQGAGIFGGGALIDERGDDTYEALGEAQGFGGPAGVGALVDLRGNDRYRAEPNPAIALGRDDYHSKNQVAASNSQGAGVGRRGDLTDGMSWAGGVGVLSDIAGNDIYEAGNFAQGLGYWYGTGMLLDAAGDDRFRSTYFSQGSGAHFSSALFYDGGGDDRHELTGASGASLGFGWDFALSLFVEAAGEDLYRSRKSSLGIADRSSLALFLELGGNDVYALEGAGRVLGAAGAAGHSIRKPNGPLRSAALASRIGLFIDLGGRDRYPLSLDSCPRSPRNDRVWQCHRGASADGKVRVHGGIDLEQPPPADVIGWILGLE